MNMVEKSNTTKKIIETKKETQEIAGQVYTQSQLELVKRTVAKGATNDELMMFMHVAKKANLDPFLKEVWFVKYKGGETLIMTGRDGFVSIAMKSGKYQGIQSVAIYENDIFEVDFSDPDNIQVRHVTKPFAKDKGKLVGAWARSTKQGARDIIEIVQFDTYNKVYAKGRSMWQLYPEAMIKKVAESIALKKHYGISGINSSEEMGEDEPKGGAKTLKNPDRHEPDEIRKEAKERDEGRPTSDLIGKIVSLLNNPASPDEFLETLNEKLGAKYKKIPDKTKELLKIYNELLKINNKSNGKSKDKDKNGEDKTV